MPKHADPEQYPTAIEAVADGHDPDVVARSLGYPDAKSWNAASVAMANVGAVFAAADARKRRADEDSEARQLKAQAGRKIPTGGLDLLAMSAAWKKAGKPYDWRTWCKTHPIKKR